MRVVALQVWTNGEIVMEEGQVADLPDALAREMIAKGLCAKASSYFDEARYIIECTLTSDTGGTTSRTAEEMTNAYNEGKKLVFRFVDFPTPGSFRDEMVTCAQFDVTTKRYSFECTLNDGAQIAKMDTSIMNADDAIFYLTVIE